MHSERKRAKATKKQKEAKDYATAEMEIGFSNGNRNFVTCPVNRSQSSYSLSPWPQSTHGFPVRSPSTLCLPHKSVLKNSHSRQVRINCFRAPRMIVSYPQRKAYFRNNKIVIFIKRDVPSLGSANMTQRIWPGFDQLQHFYELCLLGVLSF